MSPTAHPFRRVSPLDRLDALPWHVFLLVLFMVRWPLVIVGSLFAHQIFTPPQMDDPFAGMDPFVLFVFGVLVSPLIETLIECALPYAVMRKLLGERFNVIRPWAFMIVSALLMVALHPIAVAVIPAFITGFIYAYGYARFAREHILLAVILIAGLHGFSNFVGMTVAWMGWFGL